MGSPDKSCSWINDNKFHAPMPFGDRGGRRVFVAPEIIICCSMRGAKYDATLSIITHRTICQWIFGNGSFLKILRRRRSGCSLFPKSFLVSQWGCWCRRASSHCPLCCVNGDPWWISVSIAPISNRTVVVQISSRLWHYYFDRLQ